MNCYSQLVKTFSITAAIVFLSIKLFAQTPVPVFSARFQFSDQQALDTTAIFSALDEKRGKYYTSESDAKKDIDAAQKFNKELDEKAISIDSGTNALQAIAGKFAALGGLQELRQTILEQQKSKDKYQEDFKHQLKQNTKTRGLFLVVLPNTESQTDWGPPQFKDAAKQVLKARAVKELNDVFINSVTTTINRNDVKQSIKDSVAGFMDFEEIPYEWRRALKRDYIMLVYLNVTPLSGSTTQTMGTSSISLAPLHLINCENDDDVNRLIISMGLPSTEAVTLQTRISEYKIRLKKANSDAEIGIRSMWNALNSNLQNLTATIESARKEERHKSQQLKDMITQMYPDGISGITLLDSIGAIQKKLEERSAEIAESKRVNESSRLYLKENVRLELNENSPREVIAEALLNAAKDMNVNYGNKTIYTEQILLVDKKVKDAKINGYIFKRGKLKNVWANIYISPDEKYYLNMIATFDIDKQTETLPIQPQIDKIPAIESDSVITDQAGNIYRIVKIENQTWIAANLYTDRFRNGDIIDEANSIEEWKRACDNKKPAWCHYNFDSSYGLKYGKIYNRYAVADSRGLPPKKWKLPNIFDVYVLIGEGGKWASKMLKSKSGWKEWRDSDGKVLGNGKDKFKFTGLPGGFFKGSLEFQGEGDETAFWCFFLENDKYVSKIQLFNYTEDDDILGGIYSVYDGYYIRCLRETKGVEDVNICNQIWKGKDLSIERFRNGDKIPIAWSQKQWQAYNNSGEAACCFYDFDIKNFNNGVFYNWYAVSDKRGLAPAGWHIPSDDEWAELTECLGGGDKAGYKMKSTGYNGTGSSGFDVDFAGGYGSFTAGSEFFNGKYKKCFLWTQSLVDSNNAWIRLINADNGNLEKQRFNISTSGFKVRCIKD